MKESLDFEDLLLMPTALSKINSRKDVTLTLGDDLIRVKYIPLAASNMEGVGTFEMAKALTKKKWLTFIHKHYTLEEWRVFLSRNRTYRSIPTFGTSTLHLLKANDFFESFHNAVTTVCFDVANGHTQNSIDNVRKFAEDHKNIKIIYGNVANAKVLKYLPFIDAIKVGIGSGSVCSTRIKTGIGAPQASLIQEFNQYRTQNNIDIKIISDGGCRTPGDIVKAFFLGGDIVMLGGMLSGHSEGGSNGYFFGSSSNHSKSFEDKEYLTEEGLIVKIKRKGPVDLTIQDIEGGIRSAATYTGFNNLADIRRAKINVKDVFRLVRRQTNNFSNII